jgi:hypothetical protein
MEKPSVEGLANPGETDFKAWGRKKKRGNKKLLS